MLTVDKSNFCCFASSVFNHKNFISVAHYKILELMLKSELQNALTKSQQQLHAVQKQWTEDRRRRQVERNASHNKQLEA
jgi:hypothetical protein